MQNDTVKSTVVQSLDTHDPFGEFGVGSINKCAVKLCSKATSIRRIEYTRTSTIVIKALLLCMRCVLSSLYCNRRLLGLC